MVLDGRPLKTAMSAEALRELRWSPGIVGKWVLLQRVVSFGLMRQLHRGNEDVAARPAMHWDHNIDRVTSRTGGGSSEPDTAKEFIWNLLLRHIIV